MLRCGAVGGCILDGEGDLGCGDPLVGGDGSIRAAGEKGAFGGGTPSSRSFIAAFPSVMSVLSPASGIALFCVEEDEVGKVVSAASGVGADAVLLLADAVVGEGL